MGGVWENIVCPVKRSLHSLIKNTVITGFQLMTIITEIKNIINNRPLTNVNNDFDSLEALTPNYFLLRK